MASDAASPTDPTAPDSPTAVRRLDSEAARRLGHLAERFDDLQTVLGCCERLVAALSVEDGDVDGVLVEALWTTALLSYARCFAPEAEGALSEADVTAAQPGDGVLEWHAALLRLRDHHADPRTNPRERISVGVAQGDDGTAGGVALTSVPQPRVDELTVRQTGGIAYALTRALDTQIAESQRQVFEEVKAASREELEELVVLELAAPVGTP